jgi:choline dehydrogenase-like flavoprotein
MAESVPHLAVFGGMIHDSGGGRVDSIFGHPVVTYRMAPADRARIPGLLELMARAFFAAGAREVFLPILGLGGVTEERLAALDLGRVPAQRLECSSQHPLGSCRMGRSPRNSVVDTNGEAWELPGLYVADGSIMPTSLGVNPQESIMAMAARIADRMGADRMGADRMGRSHPPIS